MKVLNLTLPWSWRFCWSAYLLLFLVLLAVSAAQAQLWTPANLPAGQLKNWYDATDMHTLWQDAAATIPVSADGQTVLRWDDKSGNGNHLTSDGSGGPVYTTATLNSLPVLTFANNSISNSAPKMGKMTDNYTVIGVFKVTGNDNWDNWLRWGNGDQGGGDLIVSLDSTARTGGSAGSMEFHYDLGTGAYTTNSVVSQPAFIFVGEANQLNNPENQFTVWENDVLQVTMTSTIKTTPSSSLAYFQVGYGSTSNRNPNGYIAELLILNTGTNTLSGVDRQRIEKYLADKWGVAVVYTIPTVTTVTSSVNPSTYGNLVTFQASVQTNGLTVTAPPGNLVWMVNGVAVATNTVNDGRAAYSSSSLLPFVSTISAVYSGGSNYVGSTGSLVQTVNQAKTFAGPSHYFLLNYSPDGVDSYTIMNYVRSKFGAANQNSAVKVGVSCIYKGGGDMAKEMTLLSNDLARAQSLAIPILVQVDTENWLPVSLLNWYDPTLPGYDPAKTSDVEWYGWSPANAVMIGWRNWGTEIRVNPQPNLLSPNYLAFTKMIYTNFLPIVLQWYTNLPADQKWLFTGWKCGWETALNTHYRYFTNGNSYYGTTNNPAWSDNYQPLGYNAAQTAGIRTTGMLTSDDYGVIVGKYLAYLSSLAYSNGIPRNKIFNHGGFQDNFQYSMEALVEPYSNPGTSFYGLPSSPLSVCGSFKQAVYMAEQSYGATGYGYGEFNIHTTDYNTWYAWLQNSLRGDPDCIFQALYNYDSMKGIPSVEQAMVDFMASYPAAAITATLSGRQLMLNWPSGQGWVLQSNSISVANSNGWHTVTGATSTCTINLNLASPSAFYRLFYTAP